MCTSGEQMTNRLAYILLTTIAIAVCTGSSSAAVQGFVETFSGTGAYASQDGRLVGFDNPDWFVSGEHSSLKAEGFAIEHDPNEINVEEADLVFRQIVGVLVLESS